MDDELPRCRLPPWKEVDQWADEVARKVAASGYRAHTIVCLTRGGWVPGRLIADRLQVKRLVSLRAQHWGVTATKSGKAEITEGLSGEVAGENVLVVDDITDTGESLELATAAVKKAGAKTVKSAAFLHIGHSKFVPDFHAEEIPRGAWVWVVFPWNYWEDLRHLGKKALASTSNIGEALKLLQGQCGWSTTEEELKRATKSPD